MIGPIALLWTLASIRSTTRPPRWIRPRIGGLSFASVPRPGAPASRRRRPSRPLLRSRPAGPCDRPRRRPPRPPPFWRRGGPPLGPGRALALVALAPPFRRRRRGPARRAEPQLLGHELHV